MTPRPHRRVLVAIAALALAPAPAALAETIVATSGSEVSISSRNPQDAGSLGELSLVVEHFADANRNGVRIRQRGLGDPSISSQDARCTHNPFLNDVVCNVLPTRIVVSASEAADEVGIGGSNIGCEAGSAVETIVNLKGGNDRLDSLPCGDGTVPNSRPSPSFTALGGNGRDVLIGSVHNDSLNGESGNDLIEGGTGAGNDELIGGPGMDVLLGGGGDDQLSGGPGIDPDHIDGGPGRDRVSLAAVFAPLTVKLDGIANDGVSGEGDNYLSIEVVTGGPANDVLVGSSAAETLGGAGGNDQVTGGGGTDSLSGGDGDDLLDARDGLRETVSCGTGQDEAIVDLNDVVLLESRGAVVGLSSGRCELVGRFATDDGPPGRLTGAVLRVRGGVARARLACPRNARVTCRGILRLRRAKPRRVVAAARYAVTRGSTGTIELEIAGSLRGRILLAETVERGVSKKGPRSSSRSVRIR